MATRTLRMDTPQRKTPNVFERLSVRRSNNIQNNDKSIACQDTKKQMPKKKRLPSKETSCRPTKGVRTKKEESSDTYQQKALMEKIPETVGKDLDEVNSIVDPQKINLYPDCSIQEKNSSLNKTTKSKNLPIGSDNQSSLQHTGCNPQIYSIKNECVSLAEEVHLRSITDKNRTKNSDIYCKLAKSEKNSNDTPFKTSSPPSSSGKNFSKSKLTLECQNTKLKEINFHARMKPPQGHSFPDDVLTCKYKQVDDDKDICENDAEDEDKEFYNVRVRTRLVSYENSMLVIRNTSKQTVNEKDSQLVCEDTAALSEDDATPSEDSIASSESQLIKSPQSLPLEGTLLQGQCPSFGHSEWNHLENVQRHGGLQGVRNRIGTLVTKGRSMFSDVRNSGYVPNVRASLNALHDVTRRSLRLMTSSKDSFLAVRTTQTAEGVHDLDSGFSSMASTLDHGVNIDSTSPALEHMSDRRITSSSSFLDQEQEQEQEQEHTNKIHKQDRTEEKKESTEMDCTREPCYNSASDAISQEVSQEQVSPAVDYSEYFSCCSCSERSREGREDHGRGENASSLSICSCQSYSEFPLEIKELLDVDHARMWWTITGNFGNILPIDWSKTYTRQKYLPVLNLNEAKKVRVEGSGDSVTPSPREDDDEDVAQDLDLHHLILTGSQTEAEPVKSADEVIKEIDDIMQEASSSEDEGIDATSSDSKDTVKSGLQRLPPPLFHDKLKDLTVNELNDTLMDLEVVIRRYSETLIAQLAHRDELEYEKELKNTFISLILQVQNKRRHFSFEKKKIKKPLGPNGIDPKYLTTVIPYDVGHGPPDNETIQILIKILTAINEDSPTVPTLLTDYILKVLCPS